MTTVSGDFELTIEELRAVARYVTESAPTRSVTSCALLQVQRASVS
ncbi:hypothetical protein RHDE110596_17335 [Prescottella defluvii]|nr:hypothetical protein [Prescottella defluvii]